MNLFIGFVVLWVAVKCADGILREDVDCVPSGQSHGNTPVYLANCKPKLCYSTVPTEGFHCRIGNHEDQMPGACEKVNRNLISRTRHPPPSVEEVCQPLLSSIGLYEFRCRNLEKVVEKALNFTWTVPLCNIDYIKNSQGVKVDFRADSNSRENYFIDNPICRTFNYSESDFGGQTNFTNLPSLFEECMGIGLQNGHPDVPYYISLTEFPSGSQVNYSVMFRDVSEDSMQLLAGAWLSNRRAHVIFQPIKGIDKYHIKAESDSRTWSFSEEVSIPVVTIPNIPIFSNIVTITVSPNDNEACELHPCSSITTTLINKNFLNLPVDPPPVSAQAWGRNWKYFVIAAGVVVALGLIVLSIILYRSLQNIPPGLGETMLERLLWIADPSARQPRADEAYLARKGFTITNALQDATEPVESIRGHKVIVLVIHPSLNDTSECTNFIRVLLENKILWKRVKVLSYEKGDRLPRFALQRMFTNYHCLEDFLGNVQCYGMPQERKILVNNLIQENLRQRDCDQDSRWQAAADPDETVSLISESVASQHIEIQTESERHRLRSSHNVMNWLHNDYPTVVEEEGEDPHSDTRASLNSSTSVGPRVPDHGHREVSADVEIIGPHPPHNVCRDVENINSDTVVMVCNGEEADISSSLLKHAECNEDFDDIRKEIGSHYTGIDGGVLYYSRNHHLVTEQDTEESGGTSVKQQQHDAEAPRYSSVSCPIHVPEFACRLDIPSHEQEVFLYDESRSQPQRQSIDALSIESLVSDDDDEYDLPPVNEDACVDTLKDDTGRTMIHSANSDGLPGQEETSQIGSDGSVPTDLLTTDQHHVSLGQQTSPEFDYIGNNPTHSNLTDDLITKERDDGINHHNYTNEGNHLSYKNQNDDDEFQRQQTSGSRHEERGPCEAEYSHRDQLSSLEHSDLRHEHLDTAGQVRSQQADSAIHGQIIRNTNSSDEAVANDENVDDIGRNVVNNLVFCESDSENLDTGNGFIPTGPPGNRFIPTGPPGNAFIPTGPPGNGFIPTGPPFAPSHTNGSGLTQQNMSVPHTFSARIRLEHTGRDCNNGLLARGPQSSSEMADSPHYVGEVDDEGERIFRPDFEGDQQR